MTVVSANGQKKGHSLEEGTSLIVGRSANCGLKLIGDRISPMHCILRFQGGQLHVQDWCSESGTFVDGARIEDEVSVDPGVKLNIGNCEIQTKTGVDDTAATEQQPTDVVQQSQPLMAVDDDLEIVDESKTTVDVVPVPPNDPSAELAPNQNYGRPPVSEMQHSIPPQDMDAEVRCEAGSDEAVPPPPVETESARQETPTAWRRSPDSLPLTPNLPVDPDGGFAQETVELLQQELEYLQAELVERDNRVESTWELS